VKRMMHKIIKDFCHPFGFGEVKHVARTKLSEVSSFWLASGAFF
jgi:hypothetical protein